jgi:beta-propeller repeat-containing protein/ASPM-SPD-2-Hydin domain-containing protein
MTRKPLISVSLLSLAALAITVPAHRILCSNSPALSISSFDQTTKMQVAQAALVSSYGKLPLTFEVNQGQADARVRFLARGSGYTVFLADDESATFRLADANRRPALRDHTLPSKDSSAPPKVSDAVVRLSLAGSHPHVPVEGLDLQASYSNYFIGNNPARWQRNVPHYGRVRYRGIYPGIDLVYYGYQGQLESDYVLAPGANPHQILLKIEGSESVRLDPQAGAILSAKSGDIRLHRPVAYQEVRGKRQEIAANYIQRGHDQIGIQVGPYDVSQPLVIDPVLVYATYLGGSSSNGDHANAIAVDSSGSAYVTGQTTSTDFPTANAFSSTLNCTRAGDAFVTKFKPDGSGLLYSTYLGGSCNNLIPTLGGGDIGLGIAVDSTGAAYVTGQTGSSDFPTTPSAFQTTNGGGAIFVTKLDPTGAQLLYSTFIHGNGGEYGRAIAVDANGNAYITGVTSSTTFPVRAPGGSPFQSTIKGPATAFVCRIDPSINGIGSLVYATYLGGSSSETGGGIAVDSNANVYVTGQTTSTDFPLMNAFQIKLGGASGAQSGNAFVTRLDLNQLSTSALIYSTYLGGSGSLNATEAGDAIALDPTLNAYVAGTTASTDFPTTSGAFQTTKKNTALSAFAARFDTTKSGASSLIYSSYLNGSNDEFGSGIAVDSLGDAFVTGETVSSDFPVTSSVPQPKLAGGSDAFITEFNPTGTALLFSTYLGGASLDFGEGIALDTTAPPNVYVTGGTVSTDFPATSGAFQTTNHSSIENGFVAKLSPGVLATVFVSPTSLDFGTVLLGTASTAQMVTLTNGTQTTLNNISTKFTGTNALDFSQSATTCGSTLAAGVSCTFSIVFRPKVAGAESASLQITDSATNSPQTVTLTGNGSTPGQADFSIALNPAQATVTAGNSTTFSVTVTSLNGFASAVSLTCTGAPAAATCTLTPRIVTPSVNATATSSATMTTAALVPPMRLPRGTPPFPLIWLCTILSLALALFAAQILARRTCRKLIWTFALLSFFALAGCSGPNRGAAKTPTGTFTLTVKGVAGALSHSATFTLTVQ